MPETVLCLAGLCFVGESLRCSPRVSIWGQGGAPGLSITEAFRPGMSTFTQPRLCLEPQGLPSVRPPKFALRSEAAGGRKSEWSRTGLRAEPLNLGLGCRQMHPLPKPTRAAGHGPGSCLQPESSGWGAEAPSSGPWSGRGSDPEPWLLTSVHENRGASFAGRVLGLQEDQR